MLHLLKDQRKLLTENQYLKYTGGNTSIYNQSVYSVDMSALANNLIVATWLENSRLQQQRNQSCLAIKDPSKLEKPQQEFIANWK